MEQITLTQLKEHLENILTIHMPLFIWGSPGLGKSQSIQQIAKEKKWDLIDLRLSLLNPVDLRGLPVLDKEKGIARWFPPEFLPQDGVGILFLDELNKAPASVMAAAYQLILDRKVGNYTLPPKWRIVAAGNRETDKAQVNKLPSALANRFVHIEVKADIQSWKSWALKEKVDPRVVGFIDFKNDLLATLPQKDEKAYPTPRTWSYVSDILKLYSDADDARPMIEGAVGKGAAAEFYSYLPTFTSLPDAMAILEGKSTEVPKRADVMTALVNSLVANLTPENLGTFLDYTFNLKGEFAIIAIKGAVDAGWDEDLAKLDRWEEWSEKYADLLQ